jgi:hypothetical protein
MLVETEGVSLYTPGRGNFEAVKTGEQASRRRRTWRTSSNNEHSLTDSVSIELIKTCTSDSSESDRLKQMVRLRVRSLRVKSEWAEGRALEN